MSSALVKNETALESRQLDPVSILQSVVAGGITAENVAVVEKIAAMCERMEKVNAEKAFTKAFNELQAEMPIITATSVIPNRGKYERFEDIMRRIGPLLAKHGFTVSFTMDFKDNRILETCHLSHINGYTRSNSFAVRSGGKADSDTQADCKAATTAKRNALCNALNIVIQQDCMTSEHDAGILGQHITPDQADDLRRRVRETGSDEAAFLKFAQAKTFEEIYSGKYAVLDQNLRRKERTT